ncbi:bifunctional riboflavin kinase/FAD synthetase [Leeia aquatica]|uniref:Riboflavin biosynthesis protein n=1 Tax=Leeia aquatica TaxID=2725557 RepID=A0A847S788_9NEIS|nr:bifunctional riboflavin kinase/FAD synthetase [Leeia aquatica]NLR74705.1 bifunctional riboflavin kinase/FAD synthetase [Leeia aquatica]
MRVFRGLTTRLPDPAAITIGNFDGVHQGHQALLARLMQQAWARGLPSTVVTFEPHPREFFTPQAAPVRLTSLREKLELLAACGVAQTVVLPFNHTLASQTAEQFMYDTLRDQLQCRYLLIGDDFRFGQRRSGDFQTLQQHAAQLGLALEAMTTIEHAGLRASSTAVRAALAQGELASATALLGRPYRISGRVMHGNKLGRTIGYPTANVQIKHNRPPLSGIFAVSVDGLGDRPWPGAASLGVRPTVTNDGLVTLEVYLFNFDRQIYGQHLGVRFHHKLRDEARFPDLPTLVERIGQDVTEAQAYFAQHPALLQPEALALAQPLI